MTFKAYPSEARTDVVNWLSKNGSALQFNNPFTAESVTLVGNAVEAAAATGNWTRTLSDTDEYLDVKDVADDLIPHMEGISEFTPNLIAAIVAKIGYRHG